MFSFFDALQSTLIPVSPTLTLAGTYVTPTGTPRGIVVFAHGFTGSKEDFALVLPDMAQRGWVCVAYDQRGHYESPHASSYTLDDLAHDALGVISWAKQQFGEGLPLALVGHSLGGLFVQRAAVLDPSAIDLLILLCTGPGGKVVDKNTDLTRERLDQFLAAAEGKTSQEIWDLKMTAENTAEDNPFVLFLKERFVSSDPDAMRAFAHMLNDTPSMAEDVVASGVKVAWARGEGDGSWSPELQDETAHRYGTEVVLIPDAMHNVTLENAEGTVEVLNAMLG